MRIHPTAIIDPSAKIHETVAIGPYTIISSDVEIGEGNEIANSVTIHSGTRIGKYNQIFTGGILGGAPQHLQYKSSTKTELTIGDHNVFREYCNFHRGFESGASTRVGSNNYFMGNFHTGHDCVIGDYNVFAQGSMIAGHSHIGNRIFMSGLVGLHQFCNVGDFAMIGGCSKVTLDVPPYAMVDGNPAMITGLNTLGMRRGGIDKDRYRCIVDAYKLLFRSGKTIQQALNELKKSDSPDAAAIAAFFEKSERGLTPYSRLDEDLL